MGAAKVQKSAISWDHSRFICVFQFFLFSVSDKLLDYCQTFILNSRFLFNFSDINSYSHFCLESHISQSSSALELCSLTFQVKAFSLSARLFISQNDFMLIALFCQERHVDLLAADLLLFVVRAEKQPYLCTWTLTDSPTQACRLFAEPDVESYEVSHLRLANFVVKGIVNTSQCLQGECSRASWIVEHIRANESHPSYFVLVVCMSDWLLFFSLGMSDLLVLLSRRKSKKPQAVGFLYIHILATPNTAVTNNLSNSLHCFPSSVCSISTISELLNSPYVPRRPVILNSC